MRASPEGGAPLGRPGGRKLGPPKRAMRASPEGGAPLGRPGGRKLGPPKRAMRASSGNGPGKDLRRAGADPRAYLSRATPRS